MKCQNVQSQINPILNLVPTYRQRLHYEITKTNNVDKGRRKREEVQSTARNSTPLRYGAFATEKPIKT